MSIYASDPRNAAKAVNELLKARGGVIHHIMATPYRIDQVAYRKSGWWIHIADSSDIKPGWYTSSNVTVSTIAREAQAS